MPSCPDLAILVMTTTDRQTKLITLPLTHARRVARTLSVHHVPFICIILHIHIIMHIVDDLYLLMRDQLCT